MENVHGENPRNPGVDPEILRKVITVWTLVNSGKMSVREAVKLVGVSSKTAYKYKKYALSLTDLGGGKRENTHTGNPIGSSDNTHNEVEKGIESEDPEENGGEAFSEGGEFEENTPHGGGNGEEVIVKTPYGDVPIERGERETETEHPIARRVEQLIEELKETHRALMRAQTLLSTFAPTVPPTKPAGEVKPVEPEVDVIERIAKEVERLQERRRKIAEALRKMGYEVEDIYLERSKVEELLEQERQKALEEALDEKRIEVVREIVVSIVRELKDIFKPMAEAWWNTILLSQAQQTPAQPGSAQPEVQSPPPQAPEGSGGSISLVEIPEKKSGGAEEATGEETSTESPTPTGEEE